MRALGGFCTGSRSRRAASKGVHLAPRCIHHNRPILPAACRAVPRHKLAVVHTVCSGTCISPCALTL